MKYQKWLDKNIDDLKDKKIIVTGASSGIGLYEAMYFAYKGAHVIMACRNVSKANKVKEDILKDIRELLRAQANQNTEKVEEKQNTTAENNE